MNWQSIETAPKEAEAILGFQTTPGDWENQFAICYKFGPDENNPLWMAPGGLMPTHWMPLPEPPRLEQARKEG